MFGEMESIVTCATTSKICSLISLMVTFGAARPSHTFSTFTSTGVASSRRGPISRGAFKARTANSLRSTTKRSLQLYRPVHHLGPSRSSTTTSLIFHLFFSYCWGWTFVACQSRDLFMSLEWMNAAKDNASFSVIFIMNGGIWSKFTGPKNHWILQWKDLTRFSRRGVLILKHSQFSGVRILVIFVCQVGYITQIAGNPWKFCDV